MVDWDVCVVVVCGVGGAGVRESEGVHYCKRNDEKLEFLLLSCRSRHIKSNAARDDEPSIYAIKNHGGGWLDRFLCDAHVMLLLWRLGCQCLIPWYDDGCQCLAPCGHFSSHRLCSCIFQRQR